MLTSLARVIGFFTMSAGPAGAGLRGAGFCWFVLNIPAEEVTLDRKADGIVALTGAAARIPDAIELRAVERGKRLLITGVHRATSAREIARLTPLYSKFFTCCIDLDRSALNTFGNAIETKRWAREHNFNSLRWLPPTGLCRPPWLNPRPRLPTPRLIPFRSCRRR